MKIPVKFLFAFALLIPGSQLDAQAMVRADSATLAAMRRLDFLLGEWRGEATLQFGPSRGITSRVTETARRKLDGAGLLIEGHGVGRMQEGGPEVTLHDALAVITWDRAAERYRFTAWRGDGEPIEATAQVGENRVVWGFRDPRGFDIRFTMQVTPEGRWNEVGEATRDGQTWHKFMEVNLERVGPSQP